MHSTRKIVSAISWNIIFSVFTILVQFVIVIVMARLLTPEDYGIFALANAIVAFGMHLSQRGLTTTILRQRELTESDISCGYLVCATISIVFIVLLLLVVGLMRLSAEETLKLQSEILLFMAIPLVIGIMMTPAAALLQRRLATVQANLFAIIGILVGNGGVAATFATYGYGAWSLALGAASASVITAVLTFWAERPPLHIIWDGARFRMLLREAIKLNMIRAMGMAWVQVPLIVLGFRAPTSFVGIYQRMQFLADILLQTTVCRVTGVFYVALAMRGGGHIENYRLLFLLGSTLILPIIAFIWTAADPIIEVLLGPNWAAGGWTLRLLIVAFGFYTLNNQAAGITLELAGRFRERFVSLSVATTLVLILALVVPSDRLEVFALPAIISIFVSSVALHAYMGERLRALGDLFKLLKAAALLSAATAGGGLAGAYLASYFNIHKAFYLVTIQFWIAVLLIVLIVPVVARIKEMEPFLAVAKQISPAYYARLRFIHGKV